MGFKEAINEYGKQITASFVYKGVHYRDEQILSMNPHYEGSLLKTVMRCLDIELDGEMLEETSAIVGLAIAGKAVAGVSEVIDDNTIKSPKFGVKAPGDADYSYIEYGTYIIKEAKTDEESKKLSLECYDLMLQSMIPYDLTLDYTNGVTVKGFLDAICDRFGWAKGYTTFYNCDALIDEEKYDKGDTFRDALDDVAEVAGGMIGFVDDALTIIYPTNSGEVIDGESLKSLTIGKKYGPINSVVLSRSPQEDNIYRQDGDSIEKNGLTEIRIENNQIIESRYRDDFIGGIFDALNGLQFELYELESFGIGYLNLGDFFTIQTPDGDSHTALMLCDDLKITQGLNETSHLEAPEFTETDYKAASETDKMLNKTILKVDKQAQEITGLVSKTDAIKGTVDGLSGTVTAHTQILADYEKVKLDIAKTVEVVGSSSSVTSTGYKFDMEGLHISKSVDGEVVGFENQLDNTGMYVRRGREDILTANNEGVNAINLKSRQFLIIGDNSRLENYDNGTDGSRTACFYIGG